MFSAVAWKRLNTTFRIYFGPNGGSNLTDFKCGLCYHSNMTEVSFGIILYRIQGGVIPDKTTIKFNLCKVVISTISINYLFCYMRAFVNGYTRQDFGYSIRTNPTTIAILYISVLGIEKS